MRDASLDGSREILLTLAKGYDGKDRAYLEAWGTGCSGKEAEIYKALAANPPDKDPAKWPASYANLIWRLTPAGAEGAFEKRAAATSLPEKDRVMAVTALGFIPTNAAANALLDLAGETTGMVKTQATWWLLNYKDIRWKDAGIDAALKQRKIYDPETVSITPMVVPEPGPSTMPPVADIAKLTGNVANGAQKAQACRLCHRIGEEGNEYGPAISGFAKSQTSEVVINAIINPSADIAHGFEGFEVSLKDGGKVHGLVLSSGDPIIMMSTGGITQTIPMNKVKGRPQQLGRSLMLSAEQLGLSAQDVADVVAYLKTQ
jgi:putative heme-binding domain-containing protein